MKLKIFATAASLCLTAFPSTALGLDASEFAAGLSSLFEQSDFHVTFDSAIMQGNDVILDGVSAAPGDARPKKFDLTIVFKNAGETDDGGYTADRAIIDRFVFEEDEVGFQLNGLVWENVLFYAEPPTDGLANVYHQSRLFTGPLRILLDDQEMFRVASIESSTSADEPSSMVSYEFAARGMRLDLSAVENDDQIKSAVDDFGLSLLNMELSTQSAWNVADGRMQVSNVLIDVGEVGRVSFALDILGYDEAFLSKLYELQRTAEQEGRQSDDETLDQLMHLAGALFLNGASLRFDDDGITNKLLDLAAEEQGIPRAAMTIGFAAMLPVLASELGVSEALQTSLLRAATDYMISPRSFDIQLEPNKPVRFARLAEALEHQDTMTLLEMFNFIVTANQD